MELEEVNGLDAEAADRELALLPEVLRATNWEPLVRTLSGEAGLGGDDEVILVGVERFGDEGL